MAAPFSYEELRAGFGCIHLQDAHDDPRLCDTDFKVCVRAGGSRYLGLNCSSVPKDVLLAAHGTGLHLRAKSNRCELAAHDCLQLTVGAACCGTVASHILYATQSVCSSGRGANKQSTATAVDQQQCDASALHKRVSGWCNAQLACVDALLWLRQCRHNPTRPALRVMLGKQTTLSPEHVLTSVCWLQVCCHMLASACLVPHAPAVHLCGCWWRTGWV